jgi:hypothetical protein
MSSSFAYNISITATDNFGSATKSTSVSTAETIMHFSADGSSIAFGGIATRSKNYQFYKEMRDKFDTVITNGLAVYGGGGDNGIDPNTTLDSLILTSHSHAPQGLGTFFFIHTAFYNSKATNAARAQVAFPYSKTGPMYHRCYASGAWSGWERYITASNLLDMVYPVGSYYISHTSTSPASLFGGTWHRIESRFLWAAPATSTLGLTAGEQTHTLTVEEMPSHTHDMYWRNKYVITGSGNGVTNATGGATTDGSGYVYMDATGGSKPHNNMPPYVNVAIWRRTA